MSPQDVSSWHCDVSADSRTFRLDTKLESNVRVLAKSSADVLARDVCGHGRQPQLSLHQFTALVSTVVEHRLRQCEEYIKRGCLSAPLENGACSNSRGLGVTETGEVSAEARQKSSVCANFRFV